MEELTFERIGGKRESLTSGRMLSHCRPLKSQLNQDPISGSPPGLHPSDTQFVSGPSFCLRLFLDSCQGYRKAHSGKPEGTVEVKTHNMYARVSRLWLSHDPEISKIQYLLHT